MCLVDWKGKVPKLVGKLWGLLGLARASLPARAALAEKSVGRRSRLSFCRTLLKGGEPMLWSREHGRQSITQPIVLLAFNLC